MGANAHFSGVSPGPDSSTAECSAVHSQSAAPVHPCRLALLMRCRVSASCAEGASAGEQSAGPACSVCFSELRHSRRGDCIRSPVWEMRGTNRWLLPEPGPPRIGIASLRHQITLMSALQDSGVATELESRSPSAASGPEPRRSQGNPHSRRRAGNYGTYKYRNSTPDSRCPRLVVRDASRPAFPGKAAPTLTGACGLAPARTLYGNGAPAPRGPKDRARARGLPTDG